MNRVVITAIVVTVIMGLVAVTRYVTLADLEQQIEYDVQSQVARTKGLIVNSATLEALGLLKTVEALATDEGLSRAVLAKDKKERKKLADGVFTKFQGQQKERADYLWLVDQQGDLIAEFEGDLIVPALFKGSNGAMKYPAIDLALKRQQATSDIWRLQTGALARVGVAPVWVIDASDGSKTSVIGAVIAGFPLHRQTAKRTARIMGGEVAYFHGNLVSANSFGSSQAGLVNSLTDVLRKDEMGKITLEKGQADKVVQVDVLGKRYLATAARMPVQSSKSLPSDYPRNSGAMVLLSIDDATADLENVKLSLWLLGAAASLVALFGLFLLARRFQDQVEKIQTGIADVINGDVDRNFAHVGPELDGVAHGLNVMLARILGRPEPGDEGYGQSARATMSVDTSEVSQRDSDNLALAQEPEQDYIKRIFEEYIAAREGTGEDTDVPFDRFTSKIRLSEGNLKKRFKCKTVRFKVIVKDGKVTLKPVPIY